ncbi:MAG: MFS transporter, partial [Eubacterium sp.]|nr:MFS transporter [Eubacterium sp.]
MIQYILNDYKKSRLIVAALWIVYAASYFIRTCYAAAIAPIVAEGHFSKSEIGLVGTAFFICYGAGQLISGLIGDKVNPFFMIIFGAAAGGFCCFLMPLAGSMPVMLFIWGANGVFQSMLWSPILRIFSETIDKSLSKKAILNVSLSLPVGTICAYLVSTFIIKYSGWQLVFISGGIIIILSSVLVVLVLLYSKKDLSVKAKTKSYDFEDKSNVPKGKQGVLSLAVLSGLFIIMLPSFLHGMMRDGITNWVPTMITELYGVSPSFSVFLTIVLPVFNAFGAYAVVPLYKKLGENEMKTAGVVGALALVPLLLLLLKNRMSVYVIIVLLALTTSVMYA